MIFLMDGEDGDSSLYDEPSPPPELILGDPVQPPDAPHKKTASLPINIEGSEVKRPLFTQPTVGIQSPPVEIAYLGDATTRHPEVDGACSSLVPA